MMKKIIVILTVLCLASLSFGSLCMAGNILQKEYEITRLYDYDTGYTLARCYAPSDYHVQQFFYTSLSDEGECSIACPFQVVINALNPEGDIDMIYRSEMFYIYPPDPDRYFQEGIRFGTNMNTFIGYPTEMMMYPRTALELADKTALSMIGEDSQITRTNALYVTDGEDAFLAEQSRSRKSYYNMDSPFNVLFSCRCNDVLTSFADVTYYVESPLQPFLIRMVLSTSIVHFITTDYITNASSEMYETIVPYMFFCVTVPEKEEEAFADFDLFMANTRVTDEFSIMNRMESLMLYEIVNQGWSQYDENRLWESLGREDGSFYEDQFSDYLLDRNEFTTSDGKTFKVPTSFDYVYETDNGDIYVTNGTEQPPGSVRLYAR